MKRQVTITLMTPTVIIHTMTHFSTTEGPEMFALQMNTKSMIRNSIEYVGWSKLNKLKKPKNDKDSNDKSSWFASVVRSAFGKKGETEEWEPVPIQHTRPCVLFERYLFDTMFDRSTLIIWDLKHIK